ncbi:DUF1273 domain-containing protein [Liquorilactobacillus capillatus]|uniref:UPF0398 protein FC81_GL001225 n=1 Tax=Liquorilactobacillus capillatus DSM 19910 TaxID=1423731 RepID=A0A0R1M8V1_9LACO|nr:DUF1273 domain-containing protein [Liquorilactobacillus capillatus]KRL01541.1 hypothetical protein FC81_GL001225 [Liquorilactobacillus capillatus DSM 19910]
MRLWVTGYRSYELNVFKKEDPKVEVLKNILHELLVQKLADGLEWVITGGQLGVEQWTIEVVLQMQEEYPELKVAMILPYDNFAQKWREDKQATFNLLKTKVDFSANVSAKPYETPRQLKAWQQFMLQHTDQLALIYDPEFEGKTKYDYNMAKKYQEKQTYPIDLIDMDQLQTSANDYLERKSENDLH